jgi:hypothetical protein
MKTAPKTATYTVLMTCLRTGARSDHAVCLAAYCAAIRSMVALRRSGHPMAAVRRSDEGAWLDYAYTHVLPSHLFFPARFEVAEGSRVLSTHPVNLGG